MNKCTSPDFTKACLVSIDVQNDVLDGGPLEIPGTSAVLPSIGLLVDLFRNRKLPIIHVVRLYLPDGSNVDLCRKEAFEKGFRAFISGTKGCQIPGELAGGVNLKLDTDKLLKGEVQTVSQNEFIIYKPRWGAFYETSLEDLLESINVNTLIFCGANYPNCLRTSVYQASERDYRVVLVEDAISGIYERGKEELREIGINIFTTKIFKKRLV